MNIYTEDSITLTQEYLFSKRPFIQQAIIIVISLLIFFASLWISLAPFEEVIKTSGFVRPLENISPVANSVTGRIENIAYKNGQQVKKGEILLTIDSTQISAEKDSLLKQIQKEKNDLRELYQIQESIKAEENLVSEKEEEAFLRYNLWLTSLKKQENIKNLAFEDLQRELKLSPSMTTLAKIQKLQADYTTACNDYDEIDLSFRHQIIQEIKDIELALAVNESKLKEAENALLYTKITAPISGIVQEITAFNSNDWIEAGQMLFNIIPSENGKNKIEILIPARQAGKIKKGQKVKIRFPSLPYFDFGGAEGKIITIDADSLKTQDNLKSKEKMEFWKRKGGIFWEKAGFIGNIVQTACIVCDKFREQKGSFIPKSQNRRPSKFQKQSIFSLSPRPIPQTPLPCEDCICRR